MNDKNSHALFCVPTLDDFKNPEYIEKDLEWHSFLLHPSESSNDDLQTKVSYVLTIPRLCKNSLVELLTNIARHS